LTIPNPEHLFEQAERLASFATSGQPRQADLRRAISAVYYAVLHATLTAAADKAVGHSARASLPYRLAYRSVDHRTLRDLCRAAQKTTLAEKYRQYAPGGFGSDLRAFADAVCDLQILRQDADYDPLKTFRRSDARLAIALGRSGLQRFEAASESDRDTFLSLLLYPPRL
jgi:hypothetical protein